MRRYLRNQLNAMAQTLSDAIEYLTTRPDTAGVYKVTAQCREVVACIAEHLSKELPPAAGEKVALEIETFFKTLAHCEKQSRSPSQRKGDQRVLHGVVRTLQKQVAQVAHITVDLYFLPYKASMWDSLESIYFAAKADSRCNPVVMPIPFYEYDALTRKPVFCYEGALFPKDIPLTDYRTIDLKRIHPDGIFIHNPYDLNNRVTSVAPQYYSTALHEVCDCLIYLPYAVSYPTPKGVLYNNPMIKNMDCIVCASLADKDCYIANMGQEIEEKLMVLGSPKVDKFLAYQQNKPPVPALWAQRLKGKKAVFFNSSLNGLLLGKQTYLDRLSYVLQAFEKRQDVSLIWRPHPLSKATYGAMLPALKENYEAILSDYEEKGIGILDTTPDYHTALALSDAYIGDPSSLLHLFALSGKPMMVQNANICKTYYYKEYGPPMLCAAYYKGKIYASLADQNALIAFDPLHGNLQYLGQFPGEAAGTIRRHRGAVLWKDSIYFIPYTGKAVDVYNAKTNSFSALPVPVEQGLQYSCSVQVGSKVFLFPALAGPVVCLEMENNRLTPVGVPAPLVDGTRQFNRLPLSFRSGVVVGDFIYMVTTLSTSLYRFDLRDYSFLELPLPLEKDQRAEEIALFADALWMTLRCPGGLLRYLPNTGEVEVFSTLENREESVSFEKFAFSHLSAHEERLYLFANAGTQTAAVDAVGRLLWCCSLPTACRLTDHNRNLSYRKFECSLLGEKELYVLPGYSGAVLRVNEAGEISAIPLVTPQAPPQVAYCPAQNLEGYCNVLGYRFTERRDCDLESFVEMVVKDEYLLSEKQTAAARALFQNPNGGCGAAVQETLMEALLG